MLNGTSRKVRTVGASTERPHRRPVGVLIDSHGLDGAEVDADSQVITQLKLIPS